MNVWRECECKRTIVTTPKEIAHKKKISFEKPDDLQPCKLNISKASQRQCTYPIPNYISFSERRSITAVFIYFFIKNCHISLLESNVISLADMKGITPAPTERSATASGFSSFLRSFRLVEIRKMANLVHAIVNGQKPAKNQNNVSIC